MARRIKAFGNKVRVVTEIHEVQKSGKKPCGERFTKVCPVHQDVVLVTRGKGPRNFCVKCNSRVL